MKGKRVYDSKWGHGTVVEEDQRIILVQFDWHEDYVVEYIKGRNDEYLKEGRY